MIWRYSSSATVAWSATSRRCLLAIVRCEDVGVRIDPDQRDRHRRLAGDRPRARAELAARGRRGSGWSPAAREGLEALAAELRGDPVAAAGRRLRARRGRARRSSASPSAAGGLDLLVANAGIAHYGPFADMPSRAGRGDGPRQRARHDARPSRPGSTPMLDAAAATSSSSPRAPALRAFPCGRRLRRRPRPPTRGFAEALRHELSGTGVSVTTVYPGEVETELHAHQPERLPDWRRGDEAIEPGARGRGDHRRGRGRRARGLRARRGAPARR